MNSLFGPSSIKLLLRVIASILFCYCAFSADAMAADNFSAGAFAKNISPVNLPVWVNGGISGRKIDRITDPLNARCLVLSDGKTQVAICIVDNCILPLELVDKAKELTQSKTGIALNHILIAATHTHSAVSVVGTHGTPVQQDYADALPGWIAEGVVEAQKRMVPAQWGTTSVVCDRYIYCRDWLMKPGTANSSPFSGRASDSVSMNPGHDNPNKMAPIGPVDTLVPILSIQDRQGKPISVLASFCTHYAGAPNISSDYFGIVCERLAKSLSPNSSDSFVGLMANATSGNANCIDFSKPAAPFTHVEVGTYVSDKILSVMPGIQYSSTLSLDAELDSIDLDVRMPSAADVATAKKYIETHFPDRLPTTMDENYARETVLLSEMPPTRKLNLQAIRLNDFAIVANPCESYNETGLKIRQSSPFRLTMNIGLGNGHAGYIPPPELFQLGGYTTWRCRSSCLEEQAEPKMVEGLTRVMRALHARQANPVPVSKQTKPQSPVSPLESLQWLEAPGYKVELVASEPQIVDPVSMQIDTLGRMWVVEMGDYPTEDDNPKSRIVVLEDKNRDGFFESSTVFADKLLFATGVQPWENGALVTVQGQLLMLRDTDRDMKSDSTEVWLDGFATGNPQLRANHPTLHADGWLYIASGLRGGKIKATLPFGKPTAETLDLTGSDLRVNMLTGRIESIAGPSQFGLTFDAFGRRYGCSNRNPCFEIVSERADLSLSPLSGLATALHDVSPSNAASKVHPLVNAWTTSNLHAGQFTAACGVLVSDMSTYACEPTGSLVQRRSIKRKDGLMQVTDEASEREWLASSDPWFRPVDLYEGPDGDIYVVDMYRAVIEHPEWVPAELKNRPDQRLGDSHGRIYRVRNPGKFMEKGAAERLLDNRNASLKDWLQHPDAWYRRMAAQTVLTDASKGQKAEHIETLRQVCMEPLRKADNGVIANACQLLVACDGLDEPTALAMLKSPDPELRSVVWSAMRESTREWRPKWLDAAIETFNNANASIEELQSVAWFIAASSNRDTTDAVNEFTSVAMERYAILASQALTRNNDPPHLWMAVTAAWREDAFPFLLQYQRTASEAKNELGPIARESIARMALRAASQPSLKKDVEGFVNKLAQELNDNRNASSVSTDLAILEGIARSGGLSISDGSLLEKTVQRFALSNSNSIQQRSAVTILAYSKSDSSKSLALELLASTDGALLKTAIATCSAHDTAEFTNWLLDRFPSALPEIRQDVFNAIRNNPKRLERMVEQLESGKLSTRNLDASQIQNLSGIRDSAMAARLAKVLSGAINSNRQKVVEEFSKQLASFEVNPNKNNGKAIFAKNCSACHKLDGVGAFVGPDISDSREQSYEKLLVSVLDPNRSIDANYFRYLARTDEGIVVEGLLKDSNSQTVTLQSQNGTLTTINRSEIEELKSSGTSLMPEGIESQISAADMAELLWYVKNWRYVTDNVPANATLKK